MYKPLAPAWPQAPLSLASACILSCAPPSSSPRPSSARFPSSRGKRSSRLAACFYFCVFRFLAPWPASRRGKFWNLQGQLVLRQDVGPSDFLLPSSSEVLPGARRAPGKACR